jgi:hypothetical protein
VDVALGDRDLVDRLAVAQRDRSERAGEGPVELERDVLVDDQRAVAADLDRDVGRREGERLSLGDGCRDERDERRR